MLHKKLTQNKIMVLTVIMIVIACFFAVYLRLFTEKELWYEMFAAVLGVIITAVITMILLKGQTENDTEREKAAKIFEEKLKIYQEYLHTLSDVIKDHSLSDEAKMRLEFQTSYVAMHCNPQYIVPVSDAVRKIIEYSCPDQEKNIEGKSQSGSPDPLLDSLFNVVEAFRKDLYGDSFNFDETCKSKTLDNFSNAYRNARGNNNDEKERQKRLTVDLNILSGMAQTAIFKQEQPPANDSVSESIPNKDSHENDNSLWKDAVAEWKLNGWIIEGLTPGCDWIKITNEKGNPGIIHFGISKDEYFYVSASYQKDSDFSKPLKWERGGLRSSGTWYRALEEPYCNIQNGKFVETLNNDLEMQQYIVNYVNLLKDVIERYHRTYLLKEKVGKHTDWTIFIWYWDTLACEFNCEAEGKPYMDVMETDGNMCIQLSNRYNDNEKLLNTLKRIGCEDKQPDGNGHIILDKLSPTDSDAVAARINYWIEKISN